AIYRAIRRGHLYMTVDGAATPPSFEFTAKNAIGTAEAGDELQVSGAVDLHVRSNAPDGYTTTIRNGMTAVTSDRPEREDSATAPAGPAVYWVEIQAGAEWRGLPWITSNAIYMRPAGTPAIAPPRPPAKTSDA